MSRAAFLLFALLIAPSLAGCLSGSAPAGKLGDAVAVDGKSHVMDVLQKLPYTPGYRRDEALSWWTHFVKTYNKREWGTPMNADAARFLESELKRVGYQAETLTYKGAVRVGGLDLPVDGDWKVVRGVRPGVGNASHRIALISHYDVHTGTTEGAYDDGAGTAVQFEVCKLLARVPTNHTIECLFFDGEEKGLRASEIYVRDYLKAKPNYTYDMAFGFDMTGLNYPGYSQWKFWAYAGMTARDRNFTAEMQEANMAFLNTTLFEFLKPRQTVKPEGVQSALGNVRNSDERQFERLLGVPVVRFAGGQRASDYPMYHLPGDTVEYVYLFACGYCREFLTVGRDLFHRGLDFAIIVSYYTIMGYDQFDPFRLPLTAKDDPLAAGAKPAL